MKAQIVKINPKTIVIKSEGGKFATVNKSEIDFEYKLGDVLIMEKNGDEIYYLPKSAASFSAASDFWGTKQNYIQDGSEDREKEIEKAKNKHTLSKNKKTQSAINQVIGFGVLVEWYGILQFMAIMALMLATLKASDFNFFDNMAVIPVYLIISTIYFVIGANIRRLSYAPNAVKTVAMIVICLSILAFCLNVSIGWFGSILVMDAIVLLTKIRRYEEWYFGETD